MHTVELERGAVDVDCSQVNNVVCSSINAKPQEELAANFLALTVTRRRNFVSLCRRAN